MTTTQTIPAEKTRPGIAVQKVNFYRGDQFVTQVTWIGTTEKARLHAQVTNMHHTEPGYSELYAQYLAIPR